MPQPSHSSQFTAKCHRNTYPAIDPTLPSSSASGKTILITAGHTGIGYSISQNFAKAGAANIILLARRHEVLVQKAKELSIANPGTNFHVFAASITDHDAIKKIFAQIRNSIAEPNILVTSAAYIARNATILELPSEELRASFETHVLGNSNLVREFLATGFSKENEKTIIDVSSAAAHLIFPNMSAYSVTKLAFTQWMAHLHEEFGEKGVRVHSVHPGSILTDAAKDFVVDEEKVQWDDVQLPGQFVVWLASPAGEFLKGRFVWSSWDVEELVKRKREFEDNGELLKIGLMASGKQ